MLSLLRKEQYDLLAGLTINGEILDLGGVKNSKYHSLIKGNHHVVSANISGVEADLFINAEEYFGLSSESYNAVICLNLLEHLFDYQNAVNESYRVLKSGGYLIGSTPFMFHVHGSPDDYFRYTKSALEKIFKQAGFKEIEIQELGSGLFGIIYQATISFYRFGWLNFLARSFFMFLDKVLDKVWPNNFLSKKYFPVGYFFKAKK